MQVSISGNLKLVDVRWPLHEEQVPDVHASNIDDFQKKHPDMIIYIGMLASM